MNTDNKDASKSQNNSQFTSYNPWNLLFTSRTRTESENSASSTSSKNCQPGSLHRSGQRSCACAAPRRHSTNTRRHSDMAAPQPLQLLCLVLAVAADPLPGRVPKVYNALITSNQNLEPSKAYPVYQPVLHDFGFPYQPAVFYGDYPIGNGLQPIPAAPRKDQNEAPPQPPAPAPQNPEEAKPSPESPTALPEPSNVPEEDQQEGQQEGGKATPAPPLPPNTESPIPLNQFGLPSQVLPLGRFNPAYNGFNQIGPFTYSYPSVQFYDPYDPFSLNPYVNFPSLYRPLPNVLEARHPGIPLEAPKGVPISARPAEAPPQPGQNPPPEPNDLNVLNYSSKDPAIPNVPPPPLPQGGLKSDGTE